MWNPSIPASHRTLDFFTGKVNLLIMFKEITGNFVRI
jgi:hypothetical protein